MPLPAYRDMKVEDLYKLVSQRTQRAYEVILKTKKSLFDWTANTKSDFINFEIKKIFVL